ncbi:hypothetical protein ONZ43_g3646 [Nemania bipapillata]|uniref:Uncharacterized protein n=1 Tax=Nemania bipapillata TaxID=110536 RepID=A0ACC2IW59_9PEZI|nr:hypothetical protein ONZ43_g3646 [Nemania bipapillata]
MSPSPGDGAPPSQDSKVVGGLASVFKGLAGAAKLTKSSPTVAQSSGPPIVHSGIAEQLNSMAIPQAYALPPQHVALFEQLKDGTINERVAAANSLRTVVANYPHNPVLGIWHAAKDLIEASNPTATRVAGWELLAECVKHPSSSDLERKEYFQTISTLVDSDDFHLQLVALVNLSDHGRNMSGFDYDLFPLLSTWLRSSFSMVRAARAMAKRQGQRSKSKSVITKEQKDFTDLFAFVADAIKFNSVLADDAAAEALVDALLEICLLTNNSDDMRACSGILDAIITFGVLPGNKLKQCVEILSSIHCLVPDAQKRAWNTIRILCQSHNGQATVRLLLETLSSAGADEDRKHDLRHIRGALSILKKLVSKSSEKGYPPIPYAILVDGLSKVVEATSSWKVYLDILKLSNALFCDSRGGVNAMLVDEDWTSIFDIAGACSAGAVTYLAKSSQNIASPLSQEDNDQPEAMIIKELLELVSQVENTVNQPGPLIQKQDCISFFTKVHPAIPDSAAMLVLNYYKEFRCCFPSDARWKMNLDLVVGAFFKDRNRSTDVRLQALHVVTEVYDMLELINDEAEPEFALNLVKRLLVGVTEEMDITVLQEIVSFAVSVATTTSLLMFCYITDTLTGIVGGNRSHIAIPSPQNPSVTSSASNLPASQTPADVVTKGFVQIFLRVMNVDVSKAVYLFKTLVSIVKLNNATDARLTAMKLLFRLRADWANRIFITTHTETNSLATALHRTEAAMARKLSEEVPPQPRLSRTEASSSSRSTRALKLADRASHVSWIAKNLFTDVDGSQVLDEKAQTSIDFMQRVAYADVDESAADPLFTSSRFGDIQQKRWLIGNSIVTIEQAVTSGWARITKRQPSGTSSFTICESLRPPPAHQQPLDDSARDSNSNTVAAAAAGSSTNSVLPNHLLVQLLSSMPQYNDMSRPVPLPDNDAVDRAIRVFDRNSTLDGHKVGVIYIGENQVDEVEILANVSGSSDYVEFLNGLGTLTKLKGATFDLQGLDRVYGMDGEYTFCWRDRVTELVFHVTTQMPTNLENDPRCNQKKQHIGNDYVNIIFNDSGFPFKFDTFPSEFNYVYIVITPESRASFVATRQRTPKDVEDSFYKVQVMSKPGFPEISPASETKIVSLKALPAFIRLLALNASFFSHVWANRDGGEHISSWGNRLREINRLRENYGPKTTPQGPPASSPPGTAHNHGNAGIGSQLDISRAGGTVRDSLGSLSIRRSSVATFFTSSSEQNSHRSSILSTASTDNTEVMPPTAADVLVESLDFSRWA